METLLRELVREIFLFLQAEGGTLIACCSVCKKWNAILSRKENDTILWKRAAIEKWKVRVKMQYHDFLLGCFSWKNALVTAWSPKRQFLQTFGQIKSDTEYVFLSGRYLTVIPSSILSCSTTLVTLTLGSNKLSCLPPQLSILTSLKHLFLEDNQLLSLPPQLSTLTALKHLYLYNNKLSNLPIEYSSLTNLVELCLYSNPFYTIPLPIFAFVRLEHLNIADICLSSAPPILFSSLTNLVDINLKGNGLSLVHTEFSFYLPRLRRLQF